MSTRRDPEQDLQQLLNADRGDLGHIYDKLARAEPPPRLDRIVLGEAARAIRSQRQPRAQRWLVGFGSAAGIVLAAGIAWQVGQQMQRQDAADTSSDSARSVIPVQPISAPAEVEREAVYAQPSAESVAAPQAAAPAKQESAPMRARQEKPRPAPPPAPPAPASPPVPMPELAKPKADTAQPAAAEPFPAAEESAASAAGGILREQADMAAEPAAVVEEKRASAAKAPAPSASMRLHRNIQLDPEAWLGEIIRLEEQGRHQEAIENLRLFRRKYPDHALPDALRNLDP